MPIPFSRLSNVSEEEIVELGEHDISQRPRTASSWQNIDSYYRPDSPYSHPRASPRPPPEGINRSLLHESTVQTSEFESTSLPPSFSNDPPRKRFNFRSDVKEPRSKKTSLSSQTTSTFDGNFAHGKAGWWKKQMLVDRSLRSMAVFTLLCGIVMLIIVICYMNDFVKRINRNTTSVGGRNGESCASMEGKNVAAHFFINIAATMVLGCSNTYQQLVTALKVDEIRRVLSKRGDSRVGTNSPWAINHKLQGKGKAWAAWILLIFTSIPVHFLANSIVGPSFYINMPSNVTYNPVSTDLNTSLTQQAYLNGGLFYPQPTNDPACWTALRSGIYALPASIDEVTPVYGVYQLGNSTIFSHVDVQYTENCASYVGNADIATALTETYMSITNSNPFEYTIGNCTLGTDVLCVLSGQQQKQCRMNVRMQAAFILTACLFIKAGYMLVVNFISRYNTKAHCLTYGDVIVASVLDPSLKIHNECLVNSGDGNRYKVVHTCHKHCKDPIPSMTGDTIGHCQKCLKFNHIDKAVDLPHPTLAIKYKRSLLSNLGSTAITQMLILTFTSLAMLGISITIIVTMTATTSNWKSNCKTNENESDQCTHSLGSELKSSYGTWGGFSSSASLTSLPPDKISSELTAFAISNGPQFLYSLLYLLLVYNLTLISMESEWGKWELQRKRPRATIVSGKMFEQSYYLQLPKEVLVPLMVYAALMHWLLGQALSTTETIYVDLERGVEHSIYFVTFAAYPIFMSTILMIGMTVICWWAFTYTREGFIPQMYGSIRTLCASTTELTDFNPEGIIWGDLGVGEKFRHAGFSSDEPEKIIPAELYCGRD